MRINCKTKNRHNGFVVYHWKAWAQRWLIEQHENNSNIHLSLEQQWSMLQSPNDLWAVLVWIPLKLHYSYKLQAINPLLKILTSLILEESCGFPHHRTDSYDMKLRDRMCCVEFSMQTDKSTASVVFTIYGFEHAKIERLLLLPLLQTVDQNLILHNPIHTKNIT